MVFLLVLHTEQIPSQQFSGFQKTGTAGGAFENLKWDVDIPN